MAFGGGVGLETSVVSSSVDTATGSGGTAEATSDESEGRLWDPHCRAKPFHVDEGLEGEAEAIRVRHVKLSSKVAQHDVACSCRVMEAKHAQASDDNPSASTLPECFAVNRSRATLVEFVEEIDDAESMRLHIRTQIIKESQC